MSEGAELERSLEDVFRRGVYEPMDDGDFNELALRVFRFQINENEAYRGFVLKRGIDPDEVSLWEEIPFLPARAFKSATLVSGSKSDVERIFRTSGTTEGGGRRGEHHLLRFSLYRKSLLPNFRAYLLPDEPNPIRILCLVPDPTESRDSSLASMLAEVISEAGDPGSGFFLRPDGGLAAEAFHAALRRAEDEGVVTLVAGTAFSLVRWGELAADEGWKVRLPPGSRIMETGGFKGRSVELPREVLYEALQEHLGVPEGRIVNEYGMTELLSQFYEPVLPGAPGVGGRGGNGGAPPLAERFHKEPPWVRALVLDPVTLRGVAPGDPGVLAHLDLANLWSVAAVLTEDRGLRVDDGFKLLGRSPGSEPRGCSLAMEDFLASREKGP